MIGATGLAWGPVGEGNDMLRRRILGKRKYQGKRLSGIFSTSDVQTSINDPADNDKATASTACSGFRFRADWANSGAVGGCSIFREEAARRRGLRAAAVASRGKKRSGG